MIEIGSFMTFPNFRGQIELAYEFFYQVTWGVNTHQGILRPRGYLMCYSTIKAHFDTWFLNVSLLRCLQSPGYLKCTRL